MCVFKDVVDEFEADAVEFKLYFWGESSQLWVNGEVELNGFGLVYFTDKVPECFGKSLFFKFFGQEVVGEESDFVVGRIKHLLEMQIDFLFLVIKMIGINGVDGINQR